MMIDQDLWQKANPCTLIKLDMRQTIMWYWVANGMTCHLKAVPRSHQSFLSHNVDDKKLPFRMRMWQSFHLRWWVSQAEWKKKTHFGSAFIETSEEGRKEIFFLCGETSSTCVGWTFILHHMWCPHLPSKIYLGSDIDFLLTNEDSCFQQDSVTNRI